MSKSEGITLGHIFLTRGVAEKVDENPLAALQLYASLKRHEMCDFSDGEYKEDIALNHQAARTKSGRVLATYKCACLGKIWIETAFLEGQVDLEGHRYDENITVVMYPEEY